MKSIVVYESKYGTTEKYAKWIGEELDCKVAKISDVKVDDLLNYDNIIFGGWLHAGTIKGFKNIAKNINKFKNKNLIVFSVGLSIMDDKIHEELKQNNFKDMDNIKDFYLRGGFNFKNLTAGDKVKMNMFKTILKKQNQEDINVRGMLEIYDNPADFTDRESIKPIVDAVKVTEK